MTTASDWTAADQVSSTYSPDQTPEPVPHPVHPVHPVSLGGSGGTGCLLDEVRSWLDRFITVVDEGDLDVLTLWAAHTHVCLETYTTPRLIIDSPVPGSGKTTVLEHLNRLCVSPIQAAALSSSALLARMLADGVRTLLIDEADRSLAKDNPMTAELLAILNSGYKRGGTRPVLTPGKGGDWNVTEMTTYSPVAMAGNNPNLPDDTKSRCIRVLLMPDVDEVAEESDWEWIEAEAAGLGQRLAAWADSIRDEIRQRPELPSEVKGRNRERWGPLKRVAVAAGGRWPAVVDRLAVEDVARQAEDKEAGIAVQRPHVLLLQHLRSLFTEGVTFVKTEELVGCLIRQHPETWGADSPFGKPLTAQRFGRLLKTHYNITSSRPDTNGPRGYTLGSLHPAFSRFGLDPRNEPDEPAKAAEPDVNGWVR